MVRVSGWMGMGLGVAVAGMACTTGSESTDAGPKADLVVTAVPDTYVAAGVTVMLAATAQDPSGGTMTYQWTQVTGSPVSISGATTDTLTVVAPAVKGDMVFRFVATAADGRTAHADARALVRRNTPNRPFPLQAGRTFSYAVREQVYTWAMGAVLGATDPMAVGTASLHVDTPVTVNGLDTFALTMTANVPDPGTPCTGTDAMACQSPNLMCQADSCRSNKPFFAAATVVQMDDQLWIWADEHTVATQVVDPGRTVVGAALFDGHELFTDLTRIAPMLPDTPLRLLGDIALTIPGTAPAGSLAGNMGVCVEVRDGSQGNAVLAPYRLSRAFYEAGRGLTFFQHESVPTGFDATGQVGYRDVVLTDITPAP